MNIIGLLSRYVSRAFLLSFMGTFLCFFTIIMLFDFAELQRRAGSKDISLDIKLEMIFLRSPHFLEQVLPFLVLVSALYVFWRINRSNELLIFRSIGISLWWIILPISLTALMLGAADLAIFNPLSSVMQKRYEKLEQKYLSGSHEDVKITATGLWLSEQIGTNQAIYRADRIDLATLTFMNTNIFVISPQNKFLTRLDAKTAHIDGSTLILTEGWETQSGKFAEPFKKKIIKTSLSKKTIERMRESRETISFWNLPSYIDLLESSGLHSLKYKVYWNSLLASMFWLGAMIVLAAAFSCQPQRQGKALLFLLGGLVSGFCLYFFKDVTFALGVAGKLPPLLVAWLPPLLTLMLGAALVFNQEDG